jgi:hypothetical protein
MFESGAHPASREVGWALTFLFVYSTAEMRLNKDPNSVIKTMNLLVCSSRVPLLIGHSVTHLSRSIILLGLMLLILSFNSCKVNKVASMNIKTEGAAAIEDVVINCGLLKLSSAMINIKNTTIACQTLEITDAVTTIVFEGNVTIRCNDLISGKLKTDLKVSLASGKTGAFKLEYRKMKPSFKRIFLLEGTTKGQVTIQKRT